MAPKSRAKASHDYHPPSEQKQVENEFVGFMSKPPTRTGWQSCRYFLWDSDRNAFLGRTGTSWAKLILFYTIFFSCLAATWSLFLYIFLQTLPDHEPKWTQSESIIGVNPGLSYRPAPPDANIDTNLIHFVDGADGTWGHWVSELNKVVDDWEEAPGAKYIDCTNEYPSRKEVCKFSIDSISADCRKENNFGYESGKPCVYLKLNKIIGWEPQTYSHIDDLPDEMPEYLVDLINSTYTNANKTLSQSMVWLSCEGQNAADKENIGDLSISPAPGFHANFFPFANQKGYHTPMVSVQFLQPEPGVLINVECRTWFHGVKHSRRDKLGLAHFDILVDNPAKAQAK